MGKTWETKGKAMGKHEKSEKHNKSWKNRKPVVFLGERFGATS
jgi:hypothetical protein